MTTERSTSFKHRYLGWAALLIAPAMLGARGCHVAVVGSECGGLRGEQCESGQYCDFTADAFCGAADQTGTCETTPEVCTEEFSPVCGCDGQTFGNACAAHAAGVSVASEGECDTGTGDVCGGLLGATCAAGEFCNFGPGDFCGAADATGTCEPIPEVCGEIFAPVCGCDGQTYENACTANAAGTSVVSDGACETPPVGNVCGGLLGGGCATGEFCDFPLDAICGAADATGVCESIPEFCTEEFNPVCGCDDVTYGNACVANSAGIAVASLGECGGETLPTGAVCGGLLGGSCADGAFCNLPLDAICGAADATGICEPIPLACTREFNPVCGCNDQTFGNACEANASGVAVASQGECPPATGGGVCGGLLGTTCPDSEFCSFAPEALCGAADQTGTCAPRPEVCTQLFDPVCGCDGATYGNACSAANAGISIAADGECPQTGSVCGGLLGVTCEGGEFCDFPPDAICGAADQTGICRPVPEACTQELNPVCGCNDQTFGNACTANAAGISVASQGACP